MPAAVESIHSPMSRRAVQRIDPLRDPRWQGLTSRHPRASIFHTRGWLEALYRTYGYQPGAVTTEDNSGRLSGAIVFCHVKSKLTGNRIVSVPFSDYCDPLVEHEDEERELFDALIAGNGRDYVEWRPCSPMFGACVGVPIASRYLLHRVDLTIGSDKLLGSFHHNHVLRKIRRSAREGVQYAEGRSAELLNAFYALVVKTRRGHGLPPQPCQWFRNVLDCLPEAAILRLAFKDRRPIAGILTLRHRETMIYKYGASDASFHPLGGMQLLLWKAIQQARDTGCKVFDLGRSSVDNEGLIAFKQHWGAASVPLTYWRHPAGGRFSGGKILRMSTATASYLMPLIPDWLLLRAGRSLYPHIG